MLSEPSTPGFVFDNVRRNEHLLAKCGAGTTAQQLPKVVKTGTTIVGCVFDGGVVLGADTRATEGSIVADKNCSKIHFIADSIYCCGAGTAADTEMVTRQISAQITLHRMSTGRVPRVTTAKQLLKDYLFRYQGHIGAALIIGGVDYLGPHLYSVAPHGSVDGSPYITMGSGSLAAMAVFETRYRADLNQREAVEMVRDAIAAGIFNDLGSGSNVDICVIRPDGVEYIRPYWVANEKGQRAALYRGGKPALLRSPEVRPVLADIVSTRIIRDGHSGTAVAGGEAPMDTS